MSARILIVEDDPVSQDLLASLLRARGYNVEAVDDSFGALRMIQDQSFDLVFIDYHLPEMDGYALARMMRTLGEKSGANLNMVAITADKFGLAARRGADTVFDRILAKPIEPDALFAFTEEFLQHIEDSADPILDAPLAFGNHATEGREGAAKAGRMLWRTRGLDECPAAAVFPAPTEDEKASLNTCFRLTDAVSADCWIVTSEAGLAEVANLRETAPSYLKPLFCLDDVLMPSSDGVFKVSDSNSWTTIAKVLLDYAIGVAGLSPKARTEADFDKRLLAHLYASGRPLIIRRNGDGRIALSGTGGFRVASIPAALKRLGAQRHVAMQPNAERSDEFAVAITAAGAGSLASDKVMVPAAS